MIVSGSVGCSFFFLRILFLQRRNNTAKYSSISSAFPVSRCCNVTLAPRRVLLSSYAAINYCQYANRARNIQNKPVVNRDANSMVINELREQVQSLAAELLRIRSGGADGSSGEVSAATLRGLAVASTPARQAPKPLTRASSSRTGSVDMSAPVQRELTILRARVAEAEGEVTRLTEEAKRARKRESEKGDALAEVKAELDLAYADMAAQRGGTGTEELMSEIAQAGGADGGQKAAVGTARDEAVRGRAQRTASAEDGNVSPRVGGGLGGVIKGFFGGSGPARSKSPSARGVTADGSEEAAAVAAASALESFSSGKGGGDKKGGVEAPRTRALAVVKDFHKQIQGLEEKLHDSERQRAVLERQLMHHSGGGGTGSVSGGSGSLMVGLSAKLAAAAAGDAGELSTDAVAEAKKRCVLLWLKIAEGQSKTLRFTV